MNAIMKLYYDIYICAISIPGASMLVLKDMKTILIRYLLIHVHLLIHGLNQIPHNNICNYHTGRDKLIHLDVDGFQHSSIGVCHLVPRLLPHYVKLKAPIPLGVSVAVGYDCLPHPMVRSVGFGEKAPSLPPIFEFLINP